MTPAATATRMSTKIRASIGHSMARRDIHLTLVTCGVDGEGRAIISSTEDRVKVRNLRRDPRASLCAMPDRFFGGGVQVHGTSTVVSLPEAMEPLVDYFRRSAGREQEDWEEYRRAMERERRVLIRIDIEQAERA